MCFVKVWSTLQISPHPHHSNKSGCTWLHTNTKVKYRLITLSTEWLQTAFKHVWIHQLVQNVLAYILINTMLIIHYWSWVFSSMQITIGIFHTLYFAQLFNPSTMIFITTGNTLVTSYEHHCTHGKYDPNQHMHTASFCYCKEQGETLVQKHCSSKQELLYILGLLALLQ